MKTSAVTVFKRQEIFLSGFQTFFFEESGWKRNIEYWVLNWFEYEYF